jgi:arylsulfatase A-like enzyme
MKRRFLVMLAALMSAAATASAQHPDVLFIAIDDMNDWVGFLGGHPQTHTPNIDALAARGMAFTNAHTPATSCNPARTAILTGLRPATTGIYNNGADWRTVERTRTAGSLPRHFREHGYRTLGAGKVFHAHTYDAGGFIGYNDKTAWDDFYPALDRQLPDEVGPPIRPANGNPSMRGGGGFVGFDWSPVVTDDRAMGDGQVVSWARRQLTAESRTPRFVAVGIYRPHLPWYVPKRYFDLHPLSQIELPPVIENDLGDVPEIAHHIRNLDGDANHRWVLAQGVWKDGVQGYLASISFADAMVGWLIDALDRSGRADDTIIVLWADHGFHLGEKERWRKWTLWQRTTHVPFIVVAPGVTTPGTRTGKPVSLMDIYPTLTELAGAPTPTHVEGKSLVPLLRDPEAAWDHAAVTNNGFREHSVRDERYRYTLHADGSEELYDVSQDPHEWRNLADDASLAAVKERLAKWLPETNAPSVAPDPK